jgi:D-sedoheptulose 7-phosphate isomerase
MSTDLSTMQLVSDRLRESIAVKEAMLADSDLLRTVEEAAQACIDSLRSGGKLLLFGNGGSAADAQHLAAELVGRYLRERQALPAIALTANASNITAVGNDYSYDEIFSRQLDALGNKGDVAIGISTSGNSCNVVRAVVTAEHKGLTTISLTGNSGGALLGTTQYCLRVPSTCTARIQEGHIWLGHTVCEIIEEFFSNECNIP